ncbi:MAG: ABC transporter ATP-binding protein [Acidobacteriota bacterium]|jgi:ABC-2 type transport system ATP-binding protein|nr:ABC transporter ATP-binding protein [Acidobacteriota bacterium]
MSETIIQLEEINFFYNGFQAIENVSLEIGTGVYGLLGPNGAGKTTLMKIVLGHLRPAAGKGRILGTDLESGLTEVRRRIGYMPESHCLIPGMDAVTLTSYMGELSGMPRQEAIKRAHEVLYYVGLEESRYRLADTYSSGMKQRLKLALALVHDPVLMILDEPTSGMDPGGREEMLELIADIASKGRMNMIISSHILADIETTCARVLIMNHGRIVSEQNTRDFVDRETSILEVGIKGEARAFLERLGGIQAEMDRRGFLRLYLPADFPRMSLFAIAMEAGVQIRHFRPSRITLEDAFVTAIGESRAR